MYGSRSEYCSVGAERFKRCSTCEHAGNAFDAINNNAVYLICNRLGGKWTAEIEDADCPKLNKQGNE